MSIQHITTVNKKDRKELVFSAYLMLEHYLDEDLGDVLLDKITNESAKCKATIIFNIFKQGNKQRNVDLLIKHTDIMLLILRYAINSLENLRWMMDEAFEEKEKMSDDIYMKLNMICSIAYKYKDIIFNDSEIVMR